LDLVESIHQFVSDIFHVWYQPTQQSTRKALHDYFKEQLPRMKQETEPKEFLKQILPFSLDDAKVILEILKEEELYVGTFWRGLRVTDKPQSSKCKRELELYQPFAEITQSIAKNTERYQRQRHL